MIGEGPDMAVYIFKVTMTCQKENRRLESFRMFFVFFSLGYKHQNIPNKSSVVFLLLLSCVGGGDGWLEPFISMPANPFIKSVA